MLAGTAQRAPEETDGTDVLSHAAGVDEVAVVFAGQNSPAYRLEHLWSHHVHSGTSGKGCRHEVRSSAVSASHASDCTLNGRSPDAARTRLKRGYVVTIIGSCSIYGSLLAAPTFQDTTQGDS